MEVTTKDLNTIDKMNSTGSADRAVITPVMENGKITWKTLKGALSDYTSSLAPYDELQFIEGVKTGMYSFLTEQYDYEGLPEGLDKYRVEQKVIEDGIVYIVEDGGIYYAVRATVNTWNIYKEPVSIIVNEPLSKLNGRKYIVGKTAFMIRDNIKRVSKFTLAYRYIRQMEKTLFQLEKNLLSSAPKGLIDTRLGDIEWGEEFQPSLKNSMEVIINSQDTFYAIKIPKGSSTNLADLPQQDIFIPIELTDRTDSLIKNFTFLKEQLKELLGADLNSILGKKERMITTEVNNQQELSTKTELHGFKIREIDWNTFNEVTGNNVRIILVDEEDEEAEEPDKEEVENE